MPRTITITLTATAQAVSTTLAQDDATPITHGWSRSGRGSMIADTAIDWDGEDIPDQLVDIVERAESAGLEASSLLHSEED